VKTPSWKHPSLPALLAGALHRPAAWHRRVLYVGQDVADAIGTMVPRAIASLTPGRGATAFAMLTGIEIVVPEDFPPGTFRLVEHDGCEVIGDTRTVSHEKCTIVADGTVDLSPGRSLAQA
jgi:hypothetical protein